MAFHSVNLSLLDMHHLKKDYGLRNWLLLIDLENCSRDSMFFFQVTVDTLSKKDSTRFCASFFRLFETVVNNMRNRKI